MKNNKGIEKKIYTGMMAFILMIGAITLTVTTSYAYFVAKFSIVNPENSNSKFT